MNAATGPPPVSQQGHSYVAGVITLVAALLVAAAIVFGITEGVAAIWRGLATPQVIVAAPPPAPAGAVAPASAATTVQIVIKDVPTPDGSEPAFVGPGGVGAASLFQATAGKPIKVVVKNEDVMPHTFTSPSLGVDVAIPSSGTASFTFTPSTAGTDTWYCSIPCGSWVMSHAGYMRGQVTVVTA